MRYINELKSIPHLRVIPSQANYVMVELLDGKKALNLTKELLIKHDIFIKDLSKKVKTGEYIRLAVRNKKDNDKLISALRELL